MAYLIPNKNNKVTNTKNTAPDIYLVDNEYTTKN